MDSMFAMGHVVIRRKRNVVGDDPQYVVLFRCIQTMNPVYPYNTCYTGGDTLRFCFCCCCCLRAVKLMCSFAINLAAVSLRCCETGGRRAVGAADPSAHGQRVPGWRRHLSGCFQTGLMGVGGTLGGVKRKRHNSTYRNKDFHAGRSFTLRTRTKGLLLDRGQGDSRKHIAPYGHSFIISTLPENTRIPFTYSPSIHINMGCMYTHPPSTGATSQTKPSGWSLLRRACCPLSQDSV